LGKGAWYQVDEAGVDQEEDGFMTLKRPCQRLKDYVFFFFVQRLELRQKEWALELSPNNKQSAQQ
jgi:hypothetical protein